MKKIFLLMTLTVLIGRVAVCGGVNGLTFLKFESNARSAAMGGAGTALVNEAGLLHYNPAGIAGMPHSEIQLSHTAWVHDISLQHGYGVLALGRASLGISLYNSSVGGIEVRTRPGLPESEFTARNFAGGATFAYTINRSLQAGFSAKYIYEKIFVDEASGYAFDFGVIYHSSTPGLLFGVSVLNIGSMTALRNEASKLPLTYRAGSSYKLPFRSQDFSIRLAVEAMQYSGNDKLYLLLGGELNFSDYIYGRVGLHSGVEARSFTAGIGIKHGSFRIDYAYLPLLEDFGQAHIISLGVIL